MKVACSFCISDTIERQQPSIELNTTHNDRRVIVPVNVIEGNIEDLRKKLHDIVNTLCDRSCF